MKKTLRILGTHGGFETFAEHLALYLVKQDWRVVVYCQEDSSQFVVPRKNLIKNIPHP